MLEYQDKFIEDTLELLTELESGLMNFEQNPTDLSAIEDIFRAVHSIKGNAGMFGFNITESFSHILEDVFDSLRSQKLVADKRTVDLTLHAIDLVKKMLDVKEQLDDNLKNELQELTTELKMLSGSETEDSQFFEDTPENTTKGKLYFVHYKPESGIYQRGLKPMLVFDELDELTKIKAFGVISSVPLLEKLEPNKSYFSWGIAVALSERELEDIEDVFLFHKENEYEIFAITEQEPTIIETGQLLANYLSLEQAQEAITFFNENLPKVVELETKATPLATPENQENQENQENLVDNVAEIVAEPTKSVRVAAPKLDELIHLVSELVNVNSKLEVIGKRLQDKELNSVVKDVNKLSKQFRDNALELRLIPVSSIMIKMKRLVRDVADKLGKEVEFIAEGTDTELDKTIISKIESPLMHIIRNSIDHGIETPEERLKAQKPAKGVVYFIAFYSGPYVLIRIQDDGKGIDPEFIKQKAISKGFISEEDTVTEKDLYNLVFAPGFSTAQQITAISGRGVGMDVVKRDIADIQGEIEIDSEVGLGTQITLKLPLTLSITDMLWVKIADRSYLIPLAIIESVGRNTTPENSDLMQIEYRGKLIPVISLRKKFGLEGTAPIKERAVITRLYNSYYAILADEVVGEYQAVVKPLGPIHNKLEFLSGAGLLGDGSLALILDVGRLVKLA